MKAAAAAVAAFVVFAASADTVMFRGQEIEYYGAETNLIGVAGSGTEELVFTFKTVAPGNFIKTPMNAEARVLLVGGGGAGGSVRATAFFAGGGGGAGEFLDTNNVSFAAGRTYVINVGAGGVGETNSVETVGKNGGDSSIVFTNGENTVVTNYAVRGGGGGGSRSLPGATGGSGGGGGASSDPGSSSCIAGFGCAGGRSLAQRYGGGGGGAGGAGGDSFSTNGGDGGQGLSSDISGVSINYAGGGGGGCCNPTGSPGEGKNGGGDGAKGSASNATEPAKKGQDGFGGGGGGGVRYSGGASGGCGTVIIRLTFIETPINWQEIEVSVDDRKGKIYIDENASYRWLNGDLLITYTNTDVRGALRLGDTNNSVWAFSRVLAVGGGGGGGCTTNLGSTVLGGGGGGGAGGYVERRDMLWDGAVQFDVVVGKGGAGGASNVEVGGNGRDSTIRTNSVDVVAAAKGGGGGGARSNGNDGGSGGGASRGDGAGGGEWDRKGGAGTENQGYAGGDSIGGLYVGAGGGGAGGAGGNAHGGPYTPGDGGVGTNSDITGSERWYAGGGGGAYLNGDTSHNKGGAGGIGGGGSGAGASAEGVVIPANSGVDGTGGGGGGATGVQGDNTPAGRGGDGIVIIRLSNFVVDKISLPEDKQVFSYNGKEHVGVAEYFAYTLSGTPVATNADHYTVTATIAADAPYGWADREPDDPDYRGDRVFHWSIRPLKVTVPAAQDDGFVFTIKSGTDQTAEEKSAVPWADGSGQCWTNVPGGANVAFCSLKDYIKGDAGSYKFTATLNNDYASSPNVTNFIWSSCNGTEDADPHFPKIDQHLHPRLVAWKIAQATNEITSLTLHNWQEGTTNYVPASVWTWESVAGHYAVTGTADRVLYQVADSAEGPWTAPGVADFSTIAPTDAGVYWLRAAVSKDSNHEPGNWVAAEKVIRFCVWRHPSKTLTDFVDFTTSGSSLSSPDYALQDFPVLVRLSEGSDSGRSGLPGFSYARAGTDGSQIRFVSVSNETARSEADYDNPLARDTLLPYEVEKWNVNGESIVWVKVPKMWKGAKVRMYWRRHPNAGPLLEDLLPSDTWSAYAAVWHMNSFDEDGVVADATGNGFSITGKLGRVVSSPTGGGGVLVKAANLVAPGYDDAVGPAFTFSGWYRADNYEGSGMVNFIGKKTGTNYNYRTGWSFYMNNGVNNVGASAADSVFSGSYTVSDFSKKWHHLAYSSASASATKEVYCDGFNRKTISGYIYENTLPFQVAGTGFACDEVRLMRGKPDSVQNWIADEYSTITTPNFVTFGLVNQRQIDDVGAWVNFWTVEPGIKRYWEIGELTHDAVRAAKGALSAGTVTNKFLVMPAGVEVEFPDAATPGVYLVEFNMLNPSAGTAAYPGRHILFDGTRTFDLEIVEHDPQPIDPGGADGATISGRVLTANDDTDPSRAISLQSYWRTLETDDTLNPFWVHSDAAPPSELGGMNLLNGHSHAMRLVEDGKTNEYWTLHDVYIGNMMTNDDSVADAYALSNRYNTLPWSPTSKAISTKEKWEVPGTVPRSEVGQLIMRNVEQATITMNHLLTNGIGTIYFDAVNAGAGGDVDGSNYKLVVEINPHAYQTGYEEPDNWERIPVTPLHIAGSTVQVGETVTEIDCLDVRNGGRIDSFNFYRFIAKVDRREPLRFRIRRISQNYDTEDDDPDGFIVLDNIIASWPPLMPQLQPVGSYDASLHAGKAPVLGVEGAFSVMYPAAGDTFYASARMTNGEPSKVSSARMHYRWRYADTEFDPVRLNGRDAWRVMYFNLTNTVFSTVAPLVYNGLPGDIEYYFDLTAFVPYYEYVDYFGSAEAVVKATRECASEEPEKFTPTSSGFGVYPSHGTNWFVRIREFPSEKRGWTLYTKVSDTNGAVVAAWPMEMLGAADWRACVPTVAEEEKLYFRLESAQPEGSPAAGVHFTTNRWSAESSEQLPKRLAIAASETEVWATVPCDAKTGYLMFQVNETRGDVSVARADWQDFNQWSSAATNLFVGSAVDTNTSSIVAREYEAAMTDWPASVATNVSWKEDFKVADGVVTVAIYPRDTPFSTARSEHGWTAENAMWTYAKWSLQNNPSALKSTGDDSAVQLEGRGKGRLSFIDASKSPDGLDSVSFTARVAQYNEFSDISYWKKYRLIKDGDEIVDVQMATEMTNYTFATIAALTTDGAESYDGDGSASLVAYYDPQIGCYELRASRGTGANDLRLSLYRWRVDNGVQKCTLLGTNCFSQANQNSIKKLVYNRKSPLGGLFISAAPGERNGTKVTVGVYECSDTDGVSMYTGPSGMNNHPFSCLVYNDTSAEKLTAGTFGVMSRNCPAVFVKPVCWMNGVTSVSTAGQDNKCVVKTSQTISFSGGDLYMGSASDAYYAGWFIKPARAERLSGFSGCWGLQAPEPATQKVVVQISPAGMSEWTGVFTNDVSSFTDTRVVRKIRDARKCDVRLQVLGDANDPRTDVVINGVEITQWNGQWTEHYNTWEVYRYLREKFVYTSAWMLDDDDAGRVLRLQPSRAVSATTPVSLRSPMLRGIGLLHFKWRNADPRAKLKVQINELVTDNNIVALTETTAEGGQSSAAWETIEELDFSQLPARGHRTIQINRRYNGKDNGIDYYKGMVRLVVDPAVTVEALSGDRPRTDDSYGAVEITEAYAWDLPEYDRESWSGWNFRTAGWDGADPDTFANLADGFRGLSGLLNNTLDESTLASREKTHYQDRLPNVQSPTFRTNCVGAVSFRARLYNPDDLINAGYPAVVTVYGTRQVDPSTGEPVEGTWEAAVDVLVTNRIYTTHTVKMKASSEYKAIRLGIKGVHGVVAAGVPVYDPPLRVALDDVCIWERQSQSVAFRRRFVRPFRDAEQIKLSTAVPDIAERSEQPLIGEAFGFQATVDVLDTDEIITGDPDHPISVELWYYQGAEPWGFENWRTNAGAVRVVLSPASDDGLVFRSTATASASMCPPQVADIGETHRIVQYHMIATYYDQSFDQGRHDLLSSEWSAPEWYEGFQDPNSTSAYFSAFTLLERVAPGRAWINEVNFCETDSASSKADQWVELAVPSGEDMTGWALDVYDYKGEKISSLVTLGLKGAPSSKTYTGGTPAAVASHYAFYTVKSPYTALTADATWPAFDGNGVLAYNRPYALELRRPTGIVEHRAVVQGWNQYSGKYWYAYQYDGTNLVRVMNEKYGGDWTWAEEDFHTSSGCTVGVITNQGALHAEWKSPLARTPGDINDGQYIDPNWLVRPNGGYYWIYATVLGGHMRQIINGETNLTATITIAEGKTTNIVYEVDRWYKLAECEVQPSAGSSLSAPVVKDGRSYYTLTLNNVTSRVDVAAKADASDEVAALGVTDDNPYKSAIMKWLENGTTGGEDGGEHPFKGSTLIPMHYRGKPTEPVDQELGLTDMYWLDVDPTEGGWELWGAMGDKPGTGCPGINLVDEPVIRAYSTFMHTNHLTTVWLSLYNTNSLVEYPPYRLQGLANEKSDQFSGVWTSVTFKVTMALQNGKVDDVYKPMRHFVFDRNSFRAKDDAESPFAALIEVTDPFSNQSPAIDWGWKPYSGCQLYTGWALDSRITPAGVSTLKSEDIYGPRP